MDFLNAVEIVLNHPELRTGMAELLSNQDVLEIDDYEFEHFYCDFVSMAVENNPSLLD